MLFKPDKISIEFAKMFMRSELIAVYSNLI